VSWHDPRACSGADQQASNIVRGYHGTTDDAARAIVKSAERSIRKLDLTFSTNKWDWLGNGSYFFQDALLRGYLWAVRAAEEREGMPGVVLAEIRLIDCIDLLDVKWFKALWIAHGLAIKKHQESGSPIPKQIA
jgi:hypothetical protein